MSPNLSGPLPEPGQNNLWFHYNDSDSVIVFLHGIFSDSRSCWLHEDEMNPARSVYWPALVRSDQRFGDPSIYLAGFYTGLDAGPYEIRNCADEVLGALDRQDAEGRPGPMTKPTMVFVCHSTGGIVARYLLEESEARFVAKKLGLVLIASPSYGSKWGDRMDLLAKLYNQQLGIQLQWGNWSLRDLDARFRNLLNQQRLPGLRGVEVYENHFVFHRRWLPNRNVVVTGESAGRYFGAPVLLRKTNHFTCVKPESLRHPAHELLIDFWTKEIMKTLATGPNVAAPSSPALEKQRQPTVVIEGPPTTPLGKTTYYTIISQNAVRGEWSVGGFHNNELFVVEPLGPSHQIFVEPTDAKRVGDSFTIVFTVYDPSGKSARATKRFLIVSEGVPLNDKASFWATLPGILLTGIAGVITITVVIIAVLYRVDKVEEPIGNSDYPDTKSVPTYDDFGSSQNDGAFDKSKWTLSDEQTESMEDISQKDGRLTLARKELTGPRVESGFDLIAREFHEKKVKDEWFFEAKLMVDKRQDGHISIGLSSTAPTEPFSDCILGYGEDKAETACNYYDNANYDEAEYESGSLPVEYRIWHTVGIIIKPAKMEFVYYVDTKNIGSYKPKNKEVFEKGKFTFHIGIWGDSSKPVLGYIDEVKFGPTKLSKSSSVVLERRAARRIDGNWVVLYSGNGLRP